MSRKLIYASNGRAVKPNDAVTLPDLRIAIVKNVRAPRKDSGVGRVTLQLPNGQRQDFTPAIIDALWT